MARILVAYKQFPAPTIGHAGGQSIYRLLESLRERDHDLILVGRIRDEERPHLETIQPLCERVYTVPHHRSLGGPLPLAMARSYLALRQAVIRALHETRPDLLHVEFAQTASVLLGVSHKHTTFRAHDINWFLMEQQAARQQGLARLRSRALARFFRRVEPWLYTRFDLIAAISEGDRRLLAPRCAPQPVLLLPLSPNVSFDPELAPAVPPGPNVLFVGAMSRAFNVQGVTWFLEKVWPRIHAQAPDATFYVVGSS
ncbi:MAG: glycosyltransferase, partial [Anaerolineae bacterium]